MLKAIDKEIKPFGPAPVQEMQWYDILLSILTLSLWYFVLQEKWTNERKMWNADRIKFEVLSYLKQLSDDGVDTIDKKGWALDALPKNELLFYETTGTIFTERFLKNGTRRVKTQGKGKILISNKAITISANDVKSGKRRFLFKNMTNDLTIPMIDGGDMVLFSHKGKWIHLEGSLETIKSISMVFYLMENDMKADDSISF